MTTADRRAIHRLSEVAAVFIDVGGVLMVPAPDGVRRVLTAAGLPFSEEVADRAVYGPPRADLGMSADDSDQTVMAHARSYALRLGVPDDLLSTVVPGLLEVLEQDWYPRMAAVTMPGLRTLAGLGVPLVIVTNAEGE